MESRTRKFLTIEIFTLSLNVFSTSLFAIVISNPGDLISANSPAFSTEAANLLVNPNNSFVEFSSDTEATFGNFESIIDRDSNDIALLLGASLATFSNVDFIAFDLNGSNSGGGGFEDSIWSFTDGVNSLTHNHDFLDGQNGSVVANNERLNVGDQYNDIFGTSFANDFDFGVILFDLSSVGIDVTSKNFQVTLQGGGLSCGNECPDVTFMGTISTVPSPPTSLLFFSGLVGLVTFKRRVFA